MKKSIIIFSFSAIIIAFFYFKNEQKSPSEEAQIATTGNNEEIADFNKDDRKKAVAELELPSYLPTATILKKHGFTIGFSKKYKNAYWVAYVLSCNETNGKVERTNYFKQDEILGKYSPHTDDYYYSGYDKGHLIPAGDNTSDKLSMEDSFLMSNVSPQIPAFNRGIWKRLEEQVRKWACEYDSVYVVTGSILKGKFDKIGKGKVSVPDYFYKSILIYNNSKQATISFLMYQYTEEDNLRKFAITTDSLEKRIGYDLFPRLEDNIENKIERKLDFEYWKFD